MAKLASPEGHTLRMSAGPGPGSLTERRTVTTDHGHKALCPSWQTSEALCPCCLTRVAGCRGLVTDTVHAGQRWLAVVLCLSPPGSLTPGLPCFFTCSRRRSFMAGSSARSEGTSPSLLTMLTLAPWFRKYLCRRDQSQHYLSLQCVYTHAPETRCRARPV